MFGLIVLARNAFRKYYLSALILNISNVFKTSLLSSQIYKYEVKTRRSIIDEVRHLNDTQPNVHLKIL